VATALCSQQDSTLLLVAEIGLVERKQKQQMHDQMC
jgi:hypothetical protein